MNTTNTSNVNNGNVDNEARIKTRTEVYTFDKNVKLTCTVTYINAQPLVHTKSVLFEYNGNAFDASKYSSTINRLLIKDALRPLYVVELVNYLSRIYNKCNVFEVYKTNRSDADVNDMEAYVFGDAYRSKQAISNVPARAGTLQNVDLERPTDSHQESSISIAALATATVQNDDLERSTGSRQESMIWNA